MMPSIHKLLMGPWVWKQIDVCVFLYMLGAWLLQLQTPCKLHSLLEG